MERTGTGRNDDEVSRDGATVNRRAKVPTGRGVDQLVIRDSLLKRKGVFDGGLDDDTLQIFSSWNCGPTPAQRCA